MNTDEHFSAGGIVCRIVDGRVEVVLCGREQPLVWTLPKGTPDGGESTEETALREVREETGLEVCLGKDAGEIEYWFTKPETRVHKRVKFFFMSTKGGRVEDHDPEFDRVAWFFFKDALRVMTYPTEVKLLEKALSQVRAECGAE